MGADPKAELRSVFRSFDEENSGMIALSTLKRLLRLLDPTWTEDELALALKGGGGKGDHQIAYEQWIDQLPTTCTSDGRLLRSTLRAPADIGEVAGFVARVLRERGWSAVAPTTVAVKDRSGHSGSKTYMVRADAAEKNSAIALHVLRESEKLADLSVLRSRAAAALFCERGLAPECLAEGQDWFMEAWEGHCLGEPWRLNEPGDASCESGLPVSSFGSLAATWTDEKTGLSWTVYRNVGLQGLEDELRSASACSLEQAREHCVKHEAYVGFECGSQAVCFKSAMSPLLPSEGSDLYLLRQRALDSVLSVSSASVEEMGTLLGLIHDVPTCWYDRWRTSLQQHHKPLQDLRVGSLVWFFTARHGDFIDELDAETWRRWAELSPWPTSAAAARVVTCHGDFHPANVIRTAAGGLKLIDFEFAGVTMAAYDLAWAFSMYVGSPAKRRRFTTAYLEACKLSSLPEDVNALMLDIMYCRHGLGIREHAKTASHDLSAFSAYRELYERAKRCNRLRASILERNSFEDFANELGICLPRRSSEAGSQESAGLSEYGGKEEVGSMYELD
eukprot:TRINITY_DN16797_c1_g1_i3.p1 TRINITY_DN16797_c1_g1~~TRINITY_DN16797_c1_g1_i3.p1  ORF type:complete len:562 (+),score=109.81 TRINITY_DN16797_c1_g1_i3:193-1878(+)